MLRTRELYALCHDRWRPRGHPITPSYSARTANDSLARDNMEKKDTKEGEGDDPWGPWVAEQLANAPALSPYAALAKAEPVSQLQGKITFTEEAWTELIASLEGLIARGDMATFPGAVRDYARAVRHYLTLFFRAREFAVPQEGEDPADTYKRIKKDAAHMTTWLARIFPVVAIANEVFEFLLEIGAPKDAAASAVPAALDELASLEEWAERECSRRAQAFDNYEMPGGAAASS